MKFPKYIIRFILLLVMVVLGFIVAFPEWFELKGMLVEDYKQQLLKEKQKSKKSIKKAVGKIVPSFVIKWSDEITEQTNSAVKIVDKKEIYISPYSDTWRMKIALKQEIIANMKIEINNQTAEFWVKKLSPRKLYRPLQLNNFTGKILMSKSEKGKMLMVLDIDASETDLPIDGNPQFYVKGATQVEI